MGQATSCGARPARRTGMGGPSKRRTVGEPVAAVDRRAARDVSVILDWAVGGRWPPPPGPRSRTRRPATSTADDGDRGEVRRGGRAGCRRAGVVVLIVGSLARRLSGRGQLHRPGRGVRLAGRSGQFTWRVSALPSTGARSLNFWSLPVAGAGELDRGTPPLVGHLYARACARQYVDQSSSVRRGRRATSTTSAFTSLAPLLVGHADHRRPRRTVRVAEHSVLDLDRRDVLAAADDHVLLAVGDRHVAVVVDRAAVAGVEPAVDVAWRRRSPSGCSQ